MHLLRDDHDRDRDRRRATGSRRIGGGSLVAALAALRARGRRASHEARPGTERRRQAHQASKGGGLRRLASPGIDEHLRSWLLLLFVGFIHS